MGRHDGEDGNWRRRDPWVVRSIDKAAVKPPSQQKFSPWQQAGKITTGISFTSWSSSGTLVLAKARYCCSLRWVRVITARQNAQKVACVTLLFQRSRRPVDAGWYFLKGNWNYVRCGLCK
jgi:hypothetical protein